MHLDVILLTFFNITLLAYYYIKSWEARQPPGQCARLRSERSRSEPWLGTLCCVLRQDPLRVYLGVRTCELFLCFVAIVRVRAIMLTSLFSVFYVTGEFHRFLHRGRAYFTLTVPLSTQVYKWGLLNCQGKPNKLRGSHLRWTSIPSREVEMLLAA